MRDVFIGYRPRMDVCILTFFADCFKPHRRFACTLFDVLCNSCETSLFAVSVNDAANDGPNKFNELLVLCSSIVEQYYLNTIADISLSWKKITIIF